MIEINYLHRNKNLKEDERFPKKPVDKQQIYVLMNQVTDIKLLNLDVLGVKSSKYALE